MSELCISSIRKTYNPGLFKKKVKALSDLSFNVNRGEVFGLVGPNGAGKSTTIRILLGLIRPDFGSVFFRGKPLKEASIQSEVGYLPENPYLYDYLSLMELLVFCGQTSGLSAAMIAERGQLLMGRLNLLEAQKRPLRTFSKGMLQRAGICFALLHNPSVVVFDEPMSGLDPIGRQMVFDLVMELKSEGKTIFFCSHILNDVERLCDRIGLLNKGQLIKEFDQKDFLQNNQQTVFLHTSNIAESDQEKLRLNGVNIRIEKDGLLLAIPEGDFYLISDYLKKCSVNILGFRSEWMSLEDLFMQTVKEHE